METTKPIPQEPDVEIYIDIYCELYTPNITSAARVTGAATKAIANFTQEINMPLESCSSHIQQENCDTFKIIIEAKTIGKKAFSNSRQEYSWRNMVHRIGNQRFTRWQLKSYLLKRASSVSFCSYTLRKTSGSDLSMYNVYL